MPCVRPIHGYRAPGGKVTFIKTEGYTDRPQVAVPCGQCIGCRIDRASAWTTRILHEAQITEERGRGSAFITLTYDDAHLPTDHGLQINDWQKFAKRLRNNLGPFRFYHCGEYGGETRRPHYHAIIFGHDFGDDRIPIGKNARGDQRYISQDLTQAWGMGWAELGRVERASAAYVTKYTMKRITGDKAKEEYRRKKDGHEWQVQPEYATMSLKPGIGAHWYKKYGGDIHPSDETIIDGKRVKTPKYYDQLLERDNAESLRQIKHKRQAYGRTKRKDSTPDRLRDKEYILTEKEKNRKNKI